MTNDDSELDALLARLWAADDLPDDIRLHRSVADKLLALDAANARLTADLEAKDEAWVHEKSAAHHWKQDAGRYAVQFDSAHNEMRKWFDKWETAIEERDAARAELAEAREDAERYRWLRSIYFDPTKSAFRLVGPTKTEDELDAAIDAARGGE